MVNKQGFRKLSAVIFLLALTQVVLGVGRVILRTDLIDFQVYSGAVGDFLAGINPYGQLYVETIPFNYPPSALFFLLPLGFIPAKLAEFIMLGLSVVCLVVFAQIVFSLLVPKMGWEFKLVLLSLLLQSFPTKFTLVMGQVNFLVLLFVILGYYFSVRKNEAMAGFYLGLAAAIKLTPLLLISFFLFKKRYEIVVYSLVVFGLMNLAVKVVDADLFRDYYFGLLPRLLSLVSQGHYYDQSFLALLARLGVSSGVGRVVNFLMLTGGVILVLLGLKGKKGLFYEYKQFSLLLLVITMFNSFTWQHHLVFLFPAFFAGTFAFLRKRNALFGGLLVLAVLLVGVHFRDPQNPWLTYPIVASHGFFGAMILWWLISGRVVS